MADIFFITGTSGAGKTTLVEHLRKALNVEVHDFDEVGVPDGADQAWRLETTKYWLKQANGHDAYVICGSTVPEEIKAQEESRDHRLHFGYMHIDEKTIRERLHQRGWPEEELNDYINWAKHLEEHVRVEPGHLIVDVTKNGPEEVAKKYIKWIQSRI